MGERIRRRAPEPGEGELIAGPVKRVNEGERTPRTGVVYPCGDVWAAGGWYRCADMLLGCEVRSAAGC